MARKKALDILDVLDLLLTPSDANLDILLGYFFVWFEPVWLKQGIDGFVDPTPIMQNYVENGLYSALTRRILILWWSPWLNDALRNANVIYNYVAKDKEIKRLLDTEKGIQYLNFITKKLYDWAYSQVSK